MFACLATLVSRFRRFFVSSSTRNLVAFLSVTTPSMFVGCNSSYQPSQVDGQRPPPIAVAGRAASVTTILIPSSRKFILGVVPQAGQQREYFELKNTVSTPVEIERIEASCDCLDVALANRVIPANGVVIGCILVDLDHAAEFTGVMDITVIAVATTGERAATFQVEVDVRPRQEFAGLALHLATATATTPEPAPMAMNAGRANESRDAKSTAESSFSRSAPSAPAPRN